MASMNVTSGFLCSLCASHNRGNILFEDWKSFKATGNFKYVLLAATANVIRRFQLAVHSLVT
jgi:hypothetical protein